MPGLKYSAACFPGGAALTGLRVHPRLRSGSPAKAFTPRAGNRPGLKYSAACFPGGAALTELRVPRVCDPVARTG
ncbi:hypothetical protein ABLU67_00005, partial [Klebsiella sp. GN_Kp190]